MRKHINGLQFETDNLIIVKKLGNIQVFRTSKYQYILLIAGKYTVLKGKNLIDTSKTIGFKVEKYEKNKNYIHANLKDSEYLKLEKYKETHNINTSQAIKKLIDSI